MGWRNLGETGGGGARPWTLSAGGALGQGYSWGVGRLPRDKAGLRLAKGTAMICLCKRPCSCLGKDLWVGSTASSTCPLLLGEWRSTPA